MNKPNIPSDFVMIDIETLSTHPCAVITQIAAVKCDAEKATIKIMGKIQLNIDEQIKAGRKITSSTLAWTFEKGNPETIQHVTDPNWSSIFNFLKLFDPFGVVMCNGAAFDFPILRSLFTDFDPPIITPWHYRKEFCYRTLMQIFPAHDYKKMAQTWIKDRKSHDALNDAIFQGIQAIGAYRVANGLAIEKVSIFAEDK